MPRKMGDKDLMLALWKYLDGLEPALETWRVDLAEHLIGLVVKPV